MNSPNVVGVDRIQYLVMMPRFACVNQPPASAGLLPSDGAKVTVNWNDSRVCVPMSHLASISAWLMKSRHPTPSPFAQAQHATGLALPHWPSWCGYLSQQRPGDRESRLLVHLSVNLTRSTVDSIRSATSLVTRQMIYVVGVACLMGAQA